ncbi:R-spondin-2-like [Lampetra fluviatilis]
MRVRLLPLAFILLNVGDYMQGQRLPVRARRQTRMACPKGCLTCSEPNGCINCLPRYFFFLERQGMHEMGSCLPSCPAGYFGVRRPDGNVSVCQRCRLENCDTCFAKNFCTKCRAGFYLHKGKCHNACPHGFSAVNQSMECTSTEESHQRHPTPALAACELGPWGDWGPCLKNGRPCGAKWGQEARTRSGSDPAQRAAAAAAAPGGGDACQDSRETRRCRLKKRHCPDEKRKKEPGHRDAKNKPIKKNRKKDRAKQPQREVQPTGASGQ